MDLASGRRRRRGLAMAWVRFLADFDFKPRPQVTIAYRRGQAANVTTPCAAQATATGKAVRIKKVSKSDGVQGKV